MRDAASEITTPSSIIRDLDPAVERIILRCLAGDPAQRPRSARQIIEALPGGDPLAAAMAAGETPSPRIVAAAGAEGSLRPLTAWALLGTVVVLLGLMLLRVHQSRVTQRLGLTRPPEILAGRAEDLLRRFGVPEQTFRSSGFEEKQAYVAWIYVNDRSPKKWERFDRGLPIVTFWLREEAKPLLDTGPGRTPAPDRMEPVQTAPGSSAIELDPRGRLFSLRVVASDAWAPRTPDWNGLLEAAGFSPPLFTRNTPAGVPPSFADARMAWSGRHPDDGTPIRIEAAAFRGVPVYFRIVAPWDGKDLSSQVPFAQGSGFMIFMTTAAAVALTIGGVLAWRNLRLRRGDRQAAVKIATAMLFLSAAAAFLTAEHEPVFGHEMAILRSSLAPALLASAMFGLLYIAVEPYIRRRWPDRLISWARLLAGNWRDPMIGRDVMIGIVAGLVHALIAAWGDPGAPYYGDLWMLGSPQAGVSHFAMTIQRAITFGMVYMTVLVLLTIVLRRRWLAVAVMFALQLTAYLFASTEVTQVLAFLVITIVITFVVARYGLLATTAMQMAFFAIFGAPLPDAFAWYTARGLVPLVLLLAVAIWAFFTSLGGQRAFAANLLDE